MVRFKQQEAFSVLEFESNKWDYPVHNHNHFEIILIKKGIGTHTINDIPFKYKADDIFLIAPDDYHSFEVQEKTSFCYFKFTESLFRKDGNIQEKAKWMQRIESVLFNPNLIPGDIKYTTHDKENILNISEIILGEHHNSKNYSTEIIADAISMILSLIARNICNLYCEKQVQAEACKGKINEILTYVRQEIYNPEKIRIDAISKHSNISKNYISIFFKKHTGESLQHYILNYRMTLAENRIRLSDFTISEIAHQLGFTDESHLIRHFKNKFGINPGEYRKRKKITI
ncbi:MAG: AraC family transcriptional regulator [Marinifilaceae bacterium]